MTTTDDEAALMIKILCAAQLMTECFDELRDYRCYRKSLKNATVVMRKEIRLSLTKHINYVYETQDKTMSKIIQGIETKISEVSKMTALEIAELTL